MPSQNHDITVTFNGADFTYKEGLTSLPNKFHKMSDQDKVGWQCQDNSQPARRIDCVIKFEDPRTGCPFPSQNQCVIESRASNPNWFRTQPREHHGSATYKYTVYVGSHKDDPDVQVDGTKDNNLISSISGLLLVLAVGGIAITSFWFFKRRQRGR